MLYKTLTVYTPAFTLLTCPHPMQALDLYFTVRWLSDGPKRQLLQMQKDCRANPTAPAPSNPELEGHRLEYLGSISGEWMQHPKQGLLPPLMSVLIAGRHETAREMAAQKCFTVALRQEFNRSPETNRLQKFYNPLLVWYAVVQGKTLEDGVEQEVAWLYASREVIDTVITQGGETAKSIAAAIVNAIEIDFRNRTSAEQQAA